MMAIQKRPLAYWSWQNMKRRCDCPNNPDYKYYGARGISYDPKWKAYEGFAEDMLPIYKKGLTLDRIDTNGNYTKENCRWVTIVEQQNNKTTSKLITINGVTRTLKDWTTISSIKPSTVRARYYVYGWSIEKSLGMGV